jgi:hypothetical protein
MIANISLLYRSKKENGNLRKENGNLHKEIDYQHKKPQEKATQELHMVYTTFFLKVTAISRATDVLQIILKSCVGPKKLM